MDSKQPIESIMTTTMENIRDMVDVNTVIGDPVNTPDGSTVIPISRVSFGFVAGILDDLFVFIGRGPVKGGHCIS